MHVFVRRETAAAMVYGTKAKTIATKTVTRYPSFKATMITWIYSWCYKNSKEDKYLFFTALPNGIILNSTWVNAVWRYGASVLQTSLINSHSSANMGHATVFFNFSWRWIIKWKHRQWVANLYMPKLRMFVELIFGSSVRPEWSWNLFVVLNLLILKSTHFGAFRRLLQLIKVVHC